MDGNTEMTDIDILKKAIEKASNFGELIVMTSSKEDWDKLLKDRAYYGLIFSHKFAKAFWGEQDCVGTPVGNLPTDQPVETASQQNSGVPMWKYHLQQMVLEEDPVQYLKRFL